MPFEEMTQQQIQEVLAADAELRTLPGVLYLRPEWVDHRRRRAVICVYVDSRARDIVDQLPTTVGGLPVVANVEDVLTSSVLEVIDLTERRGASVA